MAARAAASTATATSGCCAVSRLRAAASTSLTVTVAPASSRWPTSRWPTLPTPATPTRRPARSVLPYRCWAQARMPWKTPNAVSRLESPAPPRSGDPPVANREVSDTTSMSCDVGADVAGRHVPAAERLHEAAVGPQQVGGLVQRRVPDDHCLAAAVVQAGERVLVGHGSGQPQRVGRRLSLAGVAVEAGSAEGRAQRRVVHSDDGGQAGLPVVAADHLLVLAVLHGWQPRRVRMPR